MAVSTNRRVVVIQKYYRCGIKMNMGLKLKLVCSSEISILKKGKIKMYVFITKDGQAEYERISSPAIIINP